MLDPDLVKRQIDNLKVSHPSLFEDEEAWLATLESETDFDKLLTQIVRRLDDTQALIIGTLERQSELTTRVKRFEHRIDSLRMLLHKLMDAADLQRVELPECTISLRNIPPSVVIIDETKLPDEMCRFERRPDKTKIKQALQSSTLVPGAALNNGGRSISLRIK